MNIHGWNEHKDKLKASIDASGEGYTLNDVREQIENGQAQWHLFHRCAIITQVDQKPMGDVCIFWLVSGDLEDLKQCEGHVIKWAKDIGCVQARFAGRKGWIRALNKDWKEVAIVAKMEL